MIRGHRISIRHAIDGIIWAVRTQPNYRIHFTLSILSLVGGLIFKISYEEFLAIYVLIFVGLAIETVNTSLEKTSDAITREYNHDIKTAKDVAAGAMLFFAIGALAVACAIFIPKIWLLFINAS
ncbi:hypothetical protein A3F03_03385 [Candidatus Roizmanbacteria bacterium RIFCSPHIGHO2_12_FULL_41_11]|uniref:Diacylglycerol kinase n=3 Tax=Candidatus Roizmaniibacteriota TaxID=1752723 RepID=A0A1F7JR20_9BACT|nr:MAG: hypothetical protein A3F03_03385 [Candidatus Roizmanbacteria bacterium RIFCSPHIGHO2_12_FULL_41_11]OGK51622.1 MAG: hypothetical protein A2966_01085 [Candidatus Roizmanbacteria bacterium RIFCSPLOWO2_01_FULL_41_22]OGK58060.1 MAG: hypothetical protein A3H86_00615 [Candidatus Roizmanbacteria bacterium RIFCSPLOWO2_02_FULL_41_9]